MEAAGNFGHTAPQVQAAGLNLVIAHYSLSDLNRHLEQTIAFNKELGVRHIICSFPDIKNPARLKDKKFSTVVESFTMEDYHWNADQFNQIGAKVKAAGMKFGYHNHTMEFAAQDSVVPFDELIRLTDPALVVIAPSPAAELGTGTVNFRAIFEAANKTNIKRYFVEQEGFDMPAFQALQIDANYMKSLNV